MELKKDDSGRIPKSSFRRLKQGYFYLNAQNLGRSSLPNTTFI